MSRVALAIGAAAMSTVACSNLLGFEPFEAADETEAGVPATVPTLTAAPDVSAPAPVDASTSTSDLGAEAEPEAEAEAAAADAGPDVSQDVGVDSAADVTGDEPAPAVVVAPDAGDAAPAKVVPICPSSQPSMCGGACVDPQTDHGNCGGCGNACAAGSSCHAGVCTRCGSYATDVTCSGTCLNVDSDPKNCGGCGVVCPSGASCNGGVCACPTGDPTTCRTATAAMCVDVATDKANCGGCGNVCSLPNASPQCAAKSCAIASCNAGFADCDKSALTGCEVNTTSDSANCGACSTASATHACTGGKICVASACVCPSGEHACAGTCVSDTSTSLTSCGTSCSACAAPTRGTATCSGAKPACGVSCSGTYATLCGSACVDTLDDSSNCGACGKACPSGVACASGVCEMPAVEAGVDAVADSAPDVDTIDSGIGDDAGDDAMVASE